MRVRTRARKAQRVSRRGRIDGRWMRATLFAALLTSISVAIARGNEDADPREPAKPAKRVAAAQHAVATVTRASRAPARLIGATTIVTEVSSGLPFAARVDTGATTCSIHCEAVEIKGADTDPKKNVGKPIRFLVKNKEGKSEWVESKIVDHVTVHTAAKNEERYKVRLKFRWQDVEKRVAVTLDDRQHMRYPLLLGRNFLRDDFLVNVSLDGNP